MVEFKAGQLLTTVKPEGLFVLSVNSNENIGLRRIVHEDLIFSRRIPVGDIFLCLEAKYFDTELNYSIKILYKENIYYAFCELNEVRVVK